MSTEYFIEQSEEDSKALLRVFACADQAGALVIPECVAELEGVEGLGKRLEAWSEILSGISVKRFDENSTSNLVQVSAEKAVDSTLDFMRTYLPSEKGKLEPSFADEIAKHRPELKWLIDAIFEKDDEEPRVYTGFYL